MMAISDNLQLISYLAAAEVYNQGGNIFSCFQPLVEAVLMSNLNNESISFLSLQKKMDDLYHLSVPKTTLRRLLENLQVQGKIKFERRKTIFPYKNELNTSFWERRSERETAIEEFFLELNNYLRTKNIDVPLSEMKEHCCRWIYMHSLELSDFISNITKERPKYIPSDSDWMYADNLVSFLLEIQINKSETYNTFLHIYNGAIQASLLNFEPEKIEYISSSKINLTNIILDTNFILRMLNLQSELDVRMAEETLASLRGEGTRFYILKQTIDEIHTSINKFLASIEPYTSHTRYLQGSKIRMTGFWDAYRRGMPKAEFLRLSNRHKLMETITNIIDVTFIDDFDDAILSQEDINELIISKNRDGYTDKSARHDLALIECCRKKRKNKLLSVSDADWWILTNDERLTYWNQSNCYEYQECLTEIQLGNLMWIQKKRTNNIGLTQTVVALSNNSAVTPQGISQFTSSINSYQKAYKDDMSKLDKISLVFASNALTAEDIHRINTEENTLEQVVEEKVLQFQTEQILREQEFNNAKEEGTKLTAQNDALNKKVEAITYQLEIEKLERQNDRLERDISDFVKEKNIRTDDYASYSLLKLFSDEHKKSTNRLLCMFITLSVIAMIAIYIKWVHPFVATLLHPVEQLSGLLQNIFCGLLIPIALTVLYYWGVSMVFATPKAPKELFLTLCDKFLSFRIARFAKKSNIYIKYNSKNIENEVFTAEQDIQLIRNNIEKLQENININKCKIKFLREHQAT